MTYNIYKAALKPSFREDEYLPNMDYRTMLQAHYIFIDFGVCVYVYKNYFGPHGPVTKEHHKNTLARYFKENHTYTDLTK